MFDIFITKIEPKTVKNALEYPNWVFSMQPKLAEFERNKVWRPIPKLEYFSIVGLKWVFKKKWIK